MTNPAGPYASHPAEQGPGGGAQVGGAPIGGTPVGGGPGPVDGTLSLETQQFDPPRPTRRLTRPREGRWIGGVCAGLGRRFGIAPNTVRLLFVLSCLLPGPQFLIYLMLWLIMPNDA